jgi:hypothetical protein
MIALCSNRLANQAGSLPSRKSESELIELQKATFSSPFWLNHRKPEDIVASHWADDAASIDHADA